MEKQSFFGEINIDYPGEACLLLGGSFMAISSSKIEQCASLFEINAEELLEIETILSAGS